MAAMAEEKSDSMQSVEIPPDMFNQLLNQNGQVGIPIGTEGEFDSNDLMQLPVMRGLQEEESRSHLKILEQPRQRGFRFRYGCEGPSHGGLPGQNSQRGKRSFPSVEICNYKGPARIVVSLVTSEDTPRPHAHSLVGKHCKDGLCTVQVGPKDMTASFPNLGILHVTRKDVVPTLKTRILAQHRLYKDLINISGENRWMEPSDAEIEKKAKEMAKDMDLSVVRLCFQTYLPDSKGHFTQPLDPVISVPVFDSKAPNATTLKICRMDKSAGCCTGGEEVYLLCDKVQKEDIQVKFFEISPDGQMVWQSLAEFGPTDVHRQYAIVFKTPAYKDINIDKPVYVHVQLKRKSDNETSDPKPFTFHPQVPDREGILRKRKKHLAHFNEYSSTYNQGGIGGNSSMGGGGAGGSTSFPFNNPNMGYSGSNYQFNQNNTSNSQPQPGTQQIPSHQSGIVANGNSSQQMVYTTSSSGQNHQPLPSIATLRKPQVMQQQQFQVQQHQQQMQQQQQPASNPVQMDFQMPPMQGAMAGQARAEHVKTEGEKNYCMDTDGFELDPNIVRDCGSPPELKNTSVLDLIPKGISRPKDTMEKNIQTDDITIDSDSMAWHVAQVTANALHDYAATGDIKTILTVQRHLIAVEDDNGDTPLHAAIINKKYDVTHALLSAVIKIPDQTIVNQTNHMKQTPLHLAVLTNQAKMVEVLMRCGANPNLRDHEGNTPLHLATKTGMTEGINFLVHGPKAKAAVQPIKADMNPTNYEGLAPIHLAVMSKNFDILKMLVSSGADVNIPDGKTGRTAVHYAIEVESFLILGYLLIEAKVDVDAVTFSGDSALHLASSLDLRAMATLLVAGGADPKLENGDMEDDSDGDVEEEDEKDEEKDEEEEEKNEKHGKTPYELASSAKMKEILSGHRTRKINAEDFDYIETRSTTTSIGSIQSEDHAKINSWDQGYFSEKTNSFSGLELKRTWPRVKSRMLGSTLITAKGDIGLLSETTLEKLASMLDENYPTTQSWFTLANRLGLSNMLNFLKHVPSPTTVILKQFEAMDGTIKELRDVLSSMNHLEALTLLDQAIAWRQEKVEEVQKYSSVHQSLAMMNLSDGHQLQHQAVH